jgi:hypothetical protein
VRAQDNQRHLDARPPQLKQLMPIPIIFCEVFSMMYINKIGFFSLQNDNAIPSPGYFQKSAKKNQYPPGSIALTTVVNRLVADLEVEP